MMAAKMTTLDFLKIKIFSNKCYNAFTSPRDIISKILSRDLNYIVNVVKWPKFGNSSISMREHIITSILYIFDQKKLFFERWSWFKINNLRLAQVIVLKLYTSSKQVKLKVRKFWGLIHTFVEVTGEKLVGGPFCFHPHPELGKRSWDN